MSNNIGVNTDGVIVEKRHEGLQVAGYKPQTVGSVAMVNTNKIAEEKILRMLDSLAAMPADQVDKRWLAIAHTDIEKGFMAMNRAIFQPKRVELDTNT